MATGGFQEQPEPVEGGNQNDEESSMHKCAICHEDFLKSSNPRRFGILPNCGHVFCLPCLRTSRKIEGATKQQRRRCPICREESDFVVPSVYYIDGYTGRESLVQNYKRNCGKKPCKYEEQRIGSCSRGADCHYNHDLVVGMNLLGQVGPVESLRMSKTNITVNQNTSPTLLEAVEEDDDLDLDQYQ
ncbi:putative E3 ubiquitin-protein ligase makorin-1 [Holothuria leucospilota]|uniref:RING-type E3 ubiquitin transferase n=1 Tax=Holothuria leucospilota TaxID=206669 RepID=A0A9Q1CLZ7_HOLLE|nr:putative E3 ubiquitin-protein ligase makorin-1 [Holothuria leucospilota]